MWNFTRSTTRTVIVLKSMSILWRNGAWQRMPQCFRWKISSPLIAWGLIVGRMTFFFRSDFFRLEFATSWSALDCRGTFPEEVWDRSQHEIRAMNQRKFLRPFEIVLETKQSSIRTHSLFKNDILPIWSMDECVYTVHVSWSSLTLGCMKTCRIWVSKNYQK